MSIDVKVVFTYIGAHPEYLTLLYNLGSEGVRRSKKGLYMDHAEIGLGTFRFF